MRQGSSYKVKIARYILAILTLTQLRVYILYIRIVRCKQVALIFTVYGFRINVLKFLWLLNRSSLPLYYYSVK